MPEPKIEEPVAMFRVRRGGFTRPVGTLLSAAEVDSIKNKKQLLRARYLEPVIVEKKASSK